MSNIAGTNVAAMLAPFTTEDRYPTHNSIFGKGGAKEVQTISERDAIPTERLSDGCTCYVVATGLTYRWLNNAWTEVQGGGGAGGGVVRLTQSEFNALSPKSDTTLYAVTLNGTLNALYLGNFLIASKDATGTTGFPYRLPFRFRL